jgi:hypothetical protein
MTVVNMQLLTLHCQFEPREKGRVSVDRVQGRTWGLLEINFEYV